MKKILLLATLLAVLPLHSPFANLVNNGDFEAGPTETTKYAFWETPGWWNRAKTDNAQGANARVNSMDESGFNATVNDRGDMVSSFSQNTKHTIEHGDEYEISLDMRAGMDWQGADRLEVILFATSDNTLSSSVVWEEIVEMGEAVGTDWTTETHTFKPVPPAAVGKTLFLNFYGVDPAESQKAGFLRVDNIVLTNKSGDGSAAPATKP
jgi:hypothetical protein